MAELILSQGILFLVAGVAGFALGYRARAFAVSLEAKSRQRDVEELRAALTEAQVRRARGN